MSSDDSEIELNQDLVYKFTSYKIMARESLGNGDKERAEYLYSEALEAIQEYRQDLENAKEKLEPEDVIPEFEHIERSLDETQEVIEHELENLP